jgi:hypothetical protein
MKPIQPSTAASVFASMGCTLRRSLMSLVIGVSVVAGGMALPVEGTELPTEPDKQTPDKQTIEANGAIAEGVYLYGQSPEPEQIGAAYAVFEINEDNRTVGAFYMPYSSFDCFQGEIAANQMNLTVTNSYDQTRYPYTLAMRDVAIASQESEIQPAPVDLVGYHPIDTLSDRDREILATCKAGHSTLR